MSGVFLMMLPIVRSGVAARPAGVRGAARTAHGPRTESSTGS